MYKDQILPVVLYAEKYETYFRDKKDREIFFRPVKPTDERGIQDLFYSLPSQEVYARFFTSLKALPHKEVRPLNMIIKDVVAINVRLSELAKEMLLQYDIFKNKVCHEALKIRTGSKN